MIIYHSPMKRFFNVPVGQHYGSFGVKRRYSYHCGIDLYTDEDTPVFAIESGIVIEVKWFTGPDAGSEWWLPTRCVSVEGDTGVIVYGEIQEYDGIEVGKELSIGDRIGSVKRVLRHDKGKPTTMLHIQLLKHGFKDDDFPSWLHDMEKPDCLLNPTNLLIQCQLSFLKYRNLLREL